MLLLIAAAVVIVLVIITVSTGVEKPNDDCRRIHLFKSNKWDAAEDVLLVGKRLENLQELQRTPRAYNKRTTAYW